MSETLMTVCVLEGIDGSPARETPVIVVNWDEEDDGELRTLVDSTLFLLAYGDTQENIEQRRAAADKGDLAKELWEVAQSVFTWRPSDHAEKTAWQAAMSAHVEKEGDSPVLFFHDLRPLPN